jgi:hypothetical protein
MAISFDTSGQANAGQNPTFNLAAAQANEIAIIFVQYSSTSVSISTPTVNGSSTGVTKIGSTYTADNGEKIEAYYLVNPPTSSVAYAVSASVNDDVTLYVGLYKGVNQGAVDSNNTGSNASTSVTLSTTVVAANCWLVSTVYGHGSGVGTPTAGTGTTVRQSRVGQGLGDSNGTVGTGSQSMGWTNTGTGTNWSGFIVSLAPALSAPVGRSVGVSQAVKRASFY